MVCAGRQGSCALAMLLAGWLWSVGALALDVQVNFVGAAFNDRHGARVTLINCSNDVMLSHHSRGI